MVVLSELVSEFLKLCTLQAPVAGRGKRVEKFEIPSTSAVKDAFRLWSGGAGDISAMLKRMGYTTKSHSRVFCFADNAGHPLLLKAERPEKRAPLGERASGSSGA